MTLSNSLRLFILVIITFLASNTIAQEFTWPRSVSTGGYIAVSDDIFGMDSNISGTALGGGNLQIMFMTINDSKIIGNYAILVRLWSRHIFAAKRTPSQISYTSFSKYPYAWTFDDVDSPLDLIYHVRYNQDIAYGYAFRYSTQLSFGLDTKHHIYGTNLPSSSEYWGYSLSASYKRDKYFQFGLVLRNLIQQHSQKHDNRVAIFNELGELKSFAFNLEMLPVVQIQPTRRLEFGVAYHPFKQLMLSADAFSDLGFSAGFEWEFSKNAFLRYGVSSKKDGIIEDENLLSMGIGMGIKYGSASLDMGWYVTPGNREPLNTTNSNGDQIQMGPGTSDVLLISLLFDVN